jgi:hypothetical protein
MSFESLLISIRDSMQNALEEEAQILLLSLLNSSGKSLQNVLEEETQIS